MSSAFGGERDESRESPIERQLSPTLKLVVWVLVVGIAAFAIYETKPPRALDAAAPPDQFSAARAHVHVQQIAREPHPLGSAANHRVRDYLIEQLTALGAEVQLQSTVGITDARRQIYAATAQNIFATIRGSANTRAVMLTSHYDSVPEGPGAADAGSGVATILETIRALRASGPLKNDLLVLLTDGEEEGLIGATAFVRDHPDIVAGVGVVMNFEARGSSGPALMFETSDRNGWLTREFARAAPYPFSSSLAYAVYKSLPNQTDMTVFKKAGMAGLNFAFNATLENYHTRRDTPENLDARSLQNLGSNALALTRHFGSLELQDVREPDRVYFDWLGSRLIDYPQSVVWAVLAILLALLVALVRVGRRRGSIAISRMLIATGGFALVLLAALGGAHLVLWLVGLATERLLVGDTVSNLLIAIACLAAGAAFAIAVQSWLAAKLGAPNSAAGQLLACAVATAVLTWMLPEASYVLQWPLLFALAGLVAALLMKEAVLPPLVASLPALLIFSPLMYLLLVSLGFNMIAVSVLAILLGVLLVLMSPLLPRMSRPLRVSVPVLLVCSAVLAARGVQLSRHGPEHPRGHTLFYAVDADEVKAAWVSFDDAPDAWTRQFLTDAPARGAAPRFTAGGPRRVLTANAELLPLEPPTAAVISDTVSENRRMLKLHVRSVRNANGLLMRIPADVKIMAVTIDGRRHEIRDAGDAGTMWLLRYNAPPPEGIQLELHLPTGAPFTCWLADRTYGLPEVPGRNYVPRPADMMPTYGSDVTLVSRQYRF